MTLRRPHDALSLRVVSLIEDGDLPMSQSERKWLIEAPEDILAEALIFVGLDPNALRKLVSSDGEAALIYPSFFCDLAQDWMVTLAYLTQRNINFRIYLINTDLSNCGIETARVRVYPRFDDDLVALLDSICTRGTVNLNAYTRRVEKALNVMRHQADTIQPNFTSEWI